MEFTVPVESLQGTVFPNTEGPGGWSASGHGSNRDPTGPALSSPE